MCEEDNKHKWLKEDIIKWLPKIKDKTNILHFSCGADSVASYLRLMENGIEPILVYHYFIKDLPMVKNYIDYFEKKFNVRIYQFPSTVFSKDLDNALYQRPVKARESFRNRIGTVLEQHTKAQFDQDLKDVIGGDCLIHLGLRYTDGIRRYQHIMKHGCKYQDKFYPIADFRIGDIQAILKKHDCKLPIEYGLWGISFESPRAWNINLIKEHCPETYKMVSHWFPQCGSGGLRDRYNKLNKHFKQRITQFGEFAQKKESCEIW